MAFPHAIWLGSVLPGASRQVSASPVTQLATHVRYPALLSWQVPFVTGKVLFRLETNGL